METTLIPKRIRVSFEDAVHDDATHEREKQLDFIPEQDMEEREACGEALINDWLDQPKEEVENWCTWEGNMFTND